MQFLNNSKDTEEIIVRRIMRRLERHFGELERTVLAENKNSNTDAGQFATDDSGATQIGRTPPVQLPSSNVTPPNLKVARAVPLKVAPAHIPVSPLPDPPVVPPTVKITAVAQPLADAISVEVRTAPQVLKIPPAPASAAPRPPTALPVVAKPPPERPKANALEPPAKPVVVPPPPPPPVVKQAASLAQASQGLQAQALSKKGEARQPSEAVLSDSPTALLFPDVPKKPQTILGMRPSFLIIFLLLILAFFVAYYFLVGDEFIY